MLWFVVCVCGIVTAFIALRFRQRWIVPWRDLGVLVDEVIHGRKPRTFLLTGNHLAQRIGVALEDVFLKQRELSQRAQQGELDVQTILGAMRDGLAVIDHEKRVRLLNAAARRMFGVGEQRAGASALETFRDTVIARRIDETLRSGVEGSETVNLHGNNSDARQVIVTALAMSEERGAVVLFHDVTHLQQLEQVRRDFVSNVSHELRTPLSIFRGYLETLLDEPQLAAAERERILRVLQKHSSRLNSLVDDLLSLARLEAPDTRLKLAPVDLREFVGRIAREWDRKAAAKDLTLSVEVVDDLPAIRVDEARLEEVVYNLLDNATKHSNSGGVIEIRVRREGEFALISVTDRGAGISTADLPRIFQRFYRADKARSRELGGTGLGLAIVKHITELHGGSVTAESQLGRGTTVRVLLPISAVEAALPGGNSPPG